MTNTTATTTTTGPGTHWPATETCESRYVPRMRQAMSSRTNGSPLVSNMFSLVYLRVESQARGGCVLSCNKHRWWGWRSGEQGLLLLGALLAVVCHQAAQTRGGKKEKGATPTANVKWTATTLNRPPGIGLHYCHCCRGETHIKHISRVKYCSSFGD